MPRGHFFTFEGGEGAGKSTQISRLAARLKESGREVMTTREPGGSPGAERIREVLLSGAAEPFGPDMEAVLFAAARRENVEKLIKPALKKGMIVLCDRYMDSSRVYQGVTGGVDMQFVLGMEQAVTEGARPDLTLIFDIDPTEGLKRAADVWQEQGPDRFEREDLSLQIARREGFLKIAKAEPERCVIIDASRDKETVARMVDDAIDNYFEKVQRNDAA